MPDVSPYDYLTEAFVRSGKCSSGDGLGIRPLEYRELQAFMEIEETLSLPDTRLIRRMSESFVKGINNGKDDFAEPPWRDEASGFWRDE